MLKIKRCYIAVIKSFLEVKNTFKKALTLETPIFLIRCKCRSGEIGRRSGLKILRAIAHAGSSPAFGTI
jgi:hypothetical protein